MNTGVSGLIKFKNKETSDGNATYFNVEDFSRFNTSKIGSAFLTTGTSMGRSLTIRYNPDNRKLSIKLTDGDRLVEWLDELNNEWDVEVDELSVFIFWKKEQSYSKNRRKLYRILKGSSILLKVIK